MDAILTFIEVVRWFEVCGNGVQGLPAAAFIQAKTTVCILQIDFIGRFGVGQSESRIRPG